MARNIILRHMRPPETWTNIGIDKRYDDDGTIHHIVQIRQKAEAKGEIVMVRIPCANEDTASALYAITLNALRESGANIVYG